jgi:hypothetical protein
LTPPLSNVSTVGATVDHGFETDKFTDSDDTSLGGGYSSSYDNIPTSDNIINVKEGRKKKDIQR